MISTLNRYFPHSCHNFGFTNLNYSCSHFLKAHIQFFSKLVNCFFSRRSMQRNIPTKKIGLCYVTCYQSSIGYCSQFTTLAITHRAWNCTCTLWSYLHEPTFIYPSNASTSCTNRLDIYSWNHHW